MAEPVDVDSVTIVAPSEGSVGGPMTMPPESREKIAERYELMAMLGAGGMGTVYRALDRELDEIVALKVLKKELAATPGMLERFRREVKLARRVTHRNVARTFDIGEHGGDRFLTMEFIEGEVLASKLARLGHLTVPETIAIARDVCAGLAAAHGAGVLHRDLKTDNVVIASDGRAVITDFGIARAVAEGEANRTAGGFVGTPAYMAPEQVEGLADLDARADLYALGAMMYELLTGVLPWTGDSVFAIASARLLKPPPDPRELIPDLPSPVAELVLHLMARRREDRPTSSEEVGKRLETLVSAPPKASQPPPRATRHRASIMRSVAVLPMLNLGAPDDAYLTQTLTEDLVDLLSVAPDLRVRPHGDASRFGRDDRDVREIGRKLGVDVVVDASLRRVEQRVRIAVRLVTVEDGFQLWAKRFERAASDVLSVADAAAPAIAHALTARAVACPRAANVDPVAQDLYLRGRYMMQRGWFEYSEQAEKLLREANERAPGDPRILGSLAIANCRLYAANQPLPDAARRAREQIDEALRIAPEQPEAHIAHGMLNFANGEIAAAVRDLHHSVKLAPTNVDALDALGRMLVELGRTQQGLELLGQALEIQPTLTLTRQAVARAYALLGLWEEAYDALGAPPSDLADLPSHVLMKARMFLWQGRRDDARALLPEIDRLPSEYARRAATGFITVVADGSMTDDMRASLGVVLPIDERLSTRRVAFNAQTRAELLATSGLHDEAIAMLEIADAHSFMDIVWFDRCPLLDPVRSRPELAKVRANVFRRASKALEQLDA